MIDAATQTLENLGLTKLEAEVYVHLLNSEPQTAYRIGKSLKKPTANVYKAIESLATKGAVMVEGGENRRCVAVPPSEFLRLLASTFQQRSDKAASLLEQFRPTSEEEVVYHLDSVALVLERCRSMLAGCQKIAVLDCFPLALAELLPDIERAADRGVEIHLETYAPVEIRGVVAVRLVSEKSSVAHWQCQQVNLVVDGEVHLVALLSANLDRVYQAIWSKSLYLSCLLHAGLLHEQKLIRLKAAAENHEHLKTILGEPHFFMEKDVPGQIKLFQRFVKV